MKRLLLSGGTVGLLSSISFATPTVVVGNKILAPNLAGQPVRISVTGGDQVQGVDVNARIADGGPTGGGTVAGPVFTGTNLVSGTIFSGNNSGQQDGTVLPQVYAGSVITPSGTVSANGLLVTFTINTAGFSTPGSSFPLRLAGFSNSDVIADSDFIANTPEGVLPSSITNGNLIITYAQDLNLDGTIGFADLLTLAQNYNRTGATPLQGDINRDGTVGFPDLLSLAQNYGQSINTNIPAPMVAALAAVPEPGSLAVAAIGIGLLGRRRR